MQKLIFLFLLAAFASCGNGSSTTSDTNSESVDTALSGPVISTDTTGAKMMNADTTGMGQAR